MINKDFLKTLCQIASPSGYESKAVQFFEEECKRIFAETFGEEFKDYAINRDAIGNSIVRVGNGDKKIMLSAHIDEIALQVQYIDDKGFIHFIKDGGVDDKAILGSTVKILNRNNGEIMGVIGKAPIHVEYYDGDAIKTATKWNNMKIDCGFESKSEASKYVSIGDPIIMMDHQFESFDGNKLFSRGIDDKSGICAVVEDLRVITQNIKHNKEKYKDFTFYFVACTQEEVGADGAAVVAKSIGPNISIDYDVTFATDDDYVKKEEWGDISLGKGGCIAYGPDKNVRLNHLFEDVCLKKKIPYQAFSVSNGGTNTEFLKIFSHNPMTETILISIPQRNMHTQVEVCDYRDIQSVVDMTLSAIDEMIDGKYQIL